MQIQLFIQTLNNNIIRTYTEFNYLELPSIYYVNYKLYVFH